MIPRSWLYVPADDPSRLAKAVGRGADALIIDLEDGVAPSAKKQARENLRSFLNSAPATPAIWVRVTSEPSELQHDLDACLHDRLDGIVLAKAEDSRQIRDVAHHLATLTGESRGLMPLIETAAAVLDLSTIASVPGVTQLQVGEADLRADLGVTFGPDESELLLVRQQVVLVSAARALLPPVAPVSVEFRDLGAFREGTERLARMGFVGRACIHPAQIEVAHDVFTPSPAEAAAARELIIAAETAAKAGKGAFTDQAGRMVDEAVIRSARRTISLADSASSS